MFRRVREVGLIIIATFMGLIIGVTVEFCLYYNIDIEGFPNNFNINVIPRAHTVRTYGSIPTLQTLQDQNISYVYDANGEKLELITYATYDMRMYGTATKDSETKDVHIFSAYQDCQKVPLAEYPQIGEVYADGICSGQYLEMRGQIYVVFDSGTVIPVSGKQFQSYSTVGTDRETGVTFNLADEKQLCGSLAEPE